MKNDGDRAKVVRKRKEGSEEKRKEMKKSWGRENRSCMCVWKEKQKMEMYVRRKKTCFVFGEREGSVWFYLIRKLMVTYRRITIILYFNFK